MIRATAAWGHVDEEGFAIPPRSIWRRRICPVSAARIPEGGRFYRRRARTPDRRRAVDRVRFQPVSRDRGAARRGGRARRAYGRRLAVRVSYHFASRGYHISNVDALAQPDGHGRRGNAARTPAGRGGADRRLR